MTDIYQKRYLEHQKKKAGQLLELRRSQRIFTNEQIEEDKLNQILETATTSPTSCNRHAILLKVIREKRDKELLSGLIIGGIGWIHRADTIVLFLADMNAYKSKDEKDFMPYCDVGFTAMAMWIKAEELGIGATYVNPNIYHNEIFEKFSKGYLFTGALVLGHYKDKAKETQRPKLKELLI